MKIFTKSILIFLTLLSFLINAQNKKSVDNLPSDFPQLTINVLNNPTPGQILFAPQDRTLFSHGTFLIILDQDGNVYKYKRIPYGAHDFKIQTNGLITYALDVPQGGVGQQAVFYITDTSLTVIDSVKAVGADSLGNKLIGDGHEFLILPNGNYVFTIKVPQIADMTQYGGKDSATVVHGMIQMLDINKNVIWEWRSWDHIPIDDTNRPLTGKLVRLNHFNTLDYTPNGNFLMGNRTNSEAIKIDGRTGDIIWRLGGRDNQFTFIGDNDANSPNYFSPHDIRMLPNGNITLFDNGNNHNPWFSRAVEYKIDTTNMTATQVWEYRHKPDDIANRNQGSVQRLPDGNTIISWGGRAQDSTSADITEVKPDGTITFELTLPPNSASYRALKYPWNIFKPVASIVKTNIVAGSTYDFNNSNDSTGTIVKVNSFSGPESNKFNLKRYNLTPVFPEFTKTPFLIYNYRLYFSSLSIASVNTDLIFDMSAFHEIKNPAKVKVYVRQNEGKGLFIPIASIYEPQNNRITVMNAGFGEYIFALDESIVTGIETNKTLPKSFSLSQNYPNPFNPSTIISYQIPSLSNVRLKVFDVLGREVATLINKEQAAGNYKVIFNASKLASGIYFYTLTAGDFILTKKLVLLK